MINNNIIKRVIDEGADSFEKIILQGIKIDIDFVLKYAGKSNNLDIIKILFENIFSNYKGEIDFNKDIISLAKRLKHSYDKPNDYIRAAISMKDEDFLLFLLYQGANSHTDSEIILKAACKYGWERIIEYLEIHDKSFVFSIQVNSNEPIKLALENENIAIAKKLLSLGAEIEKNDVRVINNSFDNEKIETIRFLLETIQHDGYITWTNISKTASSKDEFYNAVFKIISKTNYYNKLPVPLLMKLEQIASINGNSNRQKYFKKIIEEQRL